MVDQGAIPGVKIIEHAVWSDHRGRFMRTFDHDEQVAHGCDFNVRQHNISVLNGLGTLKGMHLQRSPSQEFKIVTCVVGSILDAVVDLRLNSESFGQHALVELAALDGRSVLVPPGVAHGMQNLEDHSIVCYLHSDAYRPELESGVNALDESLNIHWPIEPANLSVRDLGLPSLSQWSKQVDL